jgi:hypothetical protein
MLDIKVFLRYTYFMKTTSIDDDWEIVSRFLPPHWATKATALKALVRRRKIPTAEILLRMLLVHLGDGKSLRATVAYAEQIGWEPIEDVALLHRLRASAEWFRWICLELLQQLQVNSAWGDIAKKFRVRIVDGTSISEQGSTGSDWRIHYCFRPDTLICDTCLITDTKVVEGFDRYRVEPGDLLVGEREYCERKGIMHVVNSQGHVLVQFDATNLPLFTRQGKTFKPLEHFRSLADGNAGDWDVWYPSPEDDSRLIKGRLCALRKSKAAMALAKNRLRPMASKKGEKLQLLRAEALEHAQYVILFTTVNRHNLKGEDVLELYRGHRQIELAFKRLKSIIGIGHLPKYDPDSRIAWLYGKMFVALLAERMYREAESFSPWGYPLRRPSGLR